MDWVRTQDRPITELLTADYSFLNERLAKHYGIPGVRGSHFRRVQLPAGSSSSRLAGAGQHPHDHFDREPHVAGDPRQLDTRQPAGRAGSSPPPGVETNIDGDGTQVITTSVRAAAGSVIARTPAAPPATTMMDPVGFALENFNAIGAWRERDGDSMIDASGVLIDGTKVVGPEDLIAALMSRSDLFVTNVVEKLMTYALGRGVDYHDMPAVREIVRQAQREDLRFSALILGVVQSAPFRCRINAPRGAGLSGTRVKRRVQERAMANFITRRHLSRRAVLRGAGVALALPLLDSMIPAMSATPKPQVRFGAIYFPHGATMARWTPQDDGRDFTFSEILQPLTPYRRAHQRGYQSGSSAWRMAPEARPVITTALPRRS